jgi:phenylpropionate dioxygenase-like ring-hydroxylating dioxygenase large terminal subunit
MMNLIPPSGYTTESIFKKEQKSIFRSIWQCVGFIDDLQQHNDFITRFVGGRPVVIQNLKGELRAFDNICRHRHSIIQCDVKGNRSLTCPYHGWTYDDQGVARGIPNKDNFESSSIDNHSKITLLRHRVETCGKFVFVSLSNDSVSLTDFLGESQAVLIEVSSSLGKKVDEFELLEKTNWKICVENTLDSYHVDIVHRTSLANMVVREQEKILQCPHSHTIVGLSAQNDRRRQKLNSLLAQRPCKFEGYVHHLIFPNLTIATTQGMSFSVQLFEPVSPGVTRFTTSVFSINYENCPSAVAEALARQVAEYNRQVFVEDQVICEAVQQGLERSDDSHPGLLNSCESRILGFQRAYNAMMTESEKLGFDNIYSLSEQAPCLN